jgi:hypothetical protein
MVLGGLAGFAIIALLCVVRGQRITPRPLPPLPYATGLETVALDRGWCVDCTGVRYGRVHLNGGFTCPAGHYTPITGAITTETPAPVPHTGTGAGTTQEGAL